MESIAHLESGLLVAGVDEAGRGPLAGPVVAAAVILSDTNPITGLMDSKKLSEKRRLFLFHEIVEKACSFSVAEASVEEIDRINILEATLLAMRRAVEGLKVQPEHVLVDGNRAPRLALPVTTIIKGDQKVQAISAASILAKVTRDRLLLDYAKLYPEYAFEKHKGYGTKLHLESLHEHGASPVHRRSFAPVRKAIRAKEGVLSTTA